MKGRIDDNGRECTKCGAYKVWDMFSLFRKGKNGRSSQCKACTSIYAEAYRVANRVKLVEGLRAYYQANRLTLLEKEAERRRSNPEAYRLRDRARQPEKLVAQRARKAANPDKYIVRAREWRLANLERALAQERAYRDANPDKVKAATKAYRAANPHKQREADQRRRALKTKALPLWVSREAISEVFKESQRLTEATGIQHHVDHIIPLQHPQVCGLHVPANLKAIPAQLNHYKNNKFDSDLYESCSLEDYYLHLAGVPIVLDKAPTA